MIPLLVFLCLAFILYGHALWALGLVAGYVLVYGLGIMISDLIRGHYDDRDLS